MKKLISKLLASGEEYISTFKLRNQIFLQDDLENLFDQASEFGMEFFVYNREEDKPHFMTKDEILAWRRSNGSGMAFMIGKSFKEGETETNLFLTKLDA